MQRYLDTAFAEQVIAEDIATSRSIYLRVFHQGQLVGVSELALNQPPAYVPAADAVEVSRFYIHAGYRGSGAADVLLAACERHANEQTR